MNKIGMGLAITVILIISIIAIVYLQSFNPKLEEAEILWEIDLEHFAWDITAADGKVFASNNEAIFSLNSTNGQSIWNTSLSRNRGIEIYQDYIYAGSVFGIVNKLDKDTGEILAQYQAPVSSSIGSKTPPEFYLADNKVFAISDGVAVYDVNTGELFWENNRMGTLTIGNASYNTPESNHVFLYGNQRLNANNGSLIWSLLGGFDKPPIITQNQIIFWNYNPTHYDPEHFIHSVNTQIGESIWSYNVGSSVFQPTKHKDLLLFGSVEGFFYALNLTDGSLVWRKHIDTQNLLSNPDYTSTEVLDASPVYVDSADQRAYWGFIFDNEAKGQLTCLDIASGDIIWNQQFQTNGSIARESLPDKVGIATLKNTIFFTGNNHLWTFNKQIGNLTDTIIFDHYILPPVEYDNKVFIAIDLFLFAYE